MANVQRTGADGRALFKIGGRLVPLKEFEALAREYAGVATRVERERIDAVLGHGSVSKAATALGTFPARVRESLSRFLARAEEERRAGDLRRETDLPVPESRLVQLSEAVWEVRSGRIAVRITRGEGAAGARYVPAAVLRHPNNPQVEVRLDQATARESLQEALDDADLWLAVLWRIVHVVPSNHRKNDWHRESFGGNAARGAGAGAGKVRAA